MKKVWLSFLALVALTVASSWLASSLWGGKAARIELPGQVVFTPGETVGAFMARNAIPEKIMAEALGRDQAIPKEAPLASVAPSSGPRERRAKASQPSRQALFGGRLASSTKRSASQLSS